jgi:hypothetical protein
MFFYNKRTTKINKQMRKNKNHHVPNTIVVTMTCILHLLFNEEMRASFVSCDKRLFIELYTLRIKNHFHLYIMVIQDH